MKSNYVDTPAAMQVIGNIFVDTTLLNSEKYFFNEEDFTVDFHKVVFGAIYNLHNLGAENISIAAIEDYLSQRPNLLGIYKANKGAEWLSKISTSVQLSTFDYYYQRLKKMTLLRQYDDFMDISWLYDPNNFLDAKKKQAQEDWLDNTSLEEIADIIDNKIIRIRAEYIDNVNTESIQAGEGILDFISSLKETPEIGYPLYGPLVNTITRGARLKKFYIRSAATGVGKTRAMVADAASISMSEVYDTQKREWIKNPAPQNTLFMATEQEFDEVQSLLLAFVSGVDERMILDWTLTAEQEERVNKAGQIILNSSLYLKRMPDFSLKDIETTIKFHVLQFGVKYVFFDYLHSSMKILSEVSSKAGVKNLREDNVLFMISVRLKDLCNQYGIFIMTSTQLNSDYRTSKIYDQNLLRGAKSIADKIDVGMIMLEVDEEDEESLAEIIKSGFEMPTIKISVYKNRRGPYKNILMWCKEDRGTCRIIPMFVTNYKYELVKVDDLKIQIKEESAF